MCVASGRAGQGPGRSPGGVAGAGGVLEVPGREPDDLAAGNGSRGRAWGIRLCQVVPCSGDHPVRAVPLAAVIPSRVPGRGRGAWGGSASAGGQAGSIKIGARAAGCRAAAASRLAGGRMPGDLASAGHGRLFMRLAPAGWRPGRLAGGRGIGSRRRGARNRRGSTVCGPRRRGRCCAHGVPRTGRTPVLMSPPAWFLEDRLDRRPAHQAAALFGDRPAVNLGVGLAVTRAPPRRRTQLVRRREASDVADLGNEHRGQHRADPVDRLDRPIPTMIDQMSGDAPVQRNAISVSVDLDQAAATSPTGSHSRRADRGRRAGRSPGHRWAATPPCLPITACTCAFSPLRNRTSLAR